MRRVLSQLVVMCSAASEGKGLCARLSAAVLSVCVYMCVYLYVYVYMYITDAQ